MQTKVWRYIYRRVGRVVWTTCRLVLQATSIMNATQSPTASWWNQDVCRGESGQVNIRWPCFTSCLCGHAGEPRGGSLVSILARCCRPASSSDQDRPLCGGSRYLHDRYTRGFPQCISTAWSWLRYEWRGTRDGTPPKENPVVIEV